MTISHTSESLNSQPSSLTAKQLVTKRIKKNYYYNFILIVAALLPVVTVGVVNWAIDPYDLFNTPNYWGINHEKPKKDNNDRSYKAADITRIKPQVIIMGSSRTKQGIDPEHPIFDNKLTTYNLAINGPNFYEVRRYIEHAIANQPDLQEIILGVDFFMFNNNLDNQPSFDEARIGRQHIILSDVINALFSLDTLTTSIDTYQVSKQRPITNSNYGENGFMPNRKLNNGETIWRFQQSINLYFQLHSDYQFSEQYWSDFQQVVELCQQHDIDLKVFISPAHATQWESIYVTERWDTFKNWKRQLAKTLPVWDFTGYNSITTEAIAPSMNNYVDNSHYTPAIGNLILDRIYNRQSENIPSDFGILITPENIESHLAKIDSDRTAWIANHPDEVSLVIDSKHKQDNSISP
ncbi:MAG: hypothetical protein ACFCU5_14285 [Pleurocapsa sp.]